MGNACLPSSCFAGFQSAAARRSSLPVSDAMNCKSKTADDVRDSGKSDTSVGTDSCISSDAEGAFEPEERRNYAHVTLDPELAPQFFESVNLEDGPDSDAPVVDQPSWSNVDHGLLFDGTAESAECPTPADGRMPMLLGIRRMSNSSDIGVEKRDGPPLLDSVRYMDSPRRNSKQDSPKRRDSRRESQQSDLPQRQDSRRDSQQSDFPARQESRRESQQSDSSQYSQQPDLPRRLDSQQSMFSSSMRRFDFGTGLTRCAVCTAYPILNRGCAECKHRLCSKCFQTHECCLLASINELASEREGLIPTVQMAAANPAVRA